MQEICSREGVEGSEGALGLIAQAAEGSLRDALSLLDEAIAACGGRLDEERVGRLIGIVPTELLTETVEAIQAGDAARVLEQVNRIATAGHDLAAFCGELARFARNLMIARSCGLTSPLLQTGEAERAALAKLSGSLSEEDLSRYFQILLSAQSEMRYSLQPRFHLELALMKLVHAPKLVAIERLLSALKAQSAAPRGGEGGGQSSAPPRGGAKEESARTREVTRKPPDTPPWERASAGPQIPEPTTALEANHLPAQTKTAATSDLAGADLETEAEDGEPLAAALDARFAAIKAVLFEQSKFLSSCLNPVVRWRFEDGQAHFIYSRAGSWAADLLQGREHLEKLRMACEKVLGQPVKIRVTLSTEGPDVNAKPTSAQERAERDPAVMAFQKRFDCELMDVKDLSRG
ncbi:MAG: hypothetical protein KGM47_15605 [Acidobacteriota bacterium]|nr:hypothetical protein [Acidobacteriota bacterium]